MSTNMKTKLNL